MPITAVAPSDTSTLLDVAVATGLFALDEAQGLLGQVLAQQAAGDLPPGHDVACWRAEARSAPVGWCYFAPDDHADGVWNLWWIGVAPDHHGRGVGLALLDHVERTVAARGGRLLVIETSDAALLARARSFYAARGYLECGRVPHFYGVEESKVIFARRLDTSH